VAVWAINYRHFISWEPLPGWFGLPDPATITFSAAKCTFYFKVRAFWVEGGLRVLRSRVGLGSKV
jgi:hypothetical protein